jgi:hypothetical protein
MEVSLMNYKYLIVLIAFLASCHAAAGSSITDVVSDYLSGSGEQNITIERTHTELDTDLSGGQLAIIDCTFALNNSGDADGIATLIIETESGKILKKLDVYVLAKSLNEMSMKVDISFLDAMTYKNTKYRISGQRKATPQDAIDWESLVSNLDISIIKL